MANTRVLNQQLIGKINEFYTNLYGFRSDMRTLKAEIAKYELIDTEEMFLKQLIQLMSQ